MAANDNLDSYYPYAPSHALPIVFAVLIGTSWLLHIFQNLSVTYDLPLPFPQPFKC
jgi:hypothetical protein